MEPADLANRIQRIRLPHKQIAEVGELDPNTVTRIINGTGGLVASRNKVQRVLEREERELRDYLLELHPIDGQQL